MRCCHSTHGLFFRGSRGIAGGSAAVCDPNPPRPFARSRENGQKPEMEKKKRKSKWKTAPSWTGAKMAKKWPKMGFLREFSIIFSIFGLFFCHCCPCPAWGHFPFRFPIFFFHFRLLAVFHAMPARQDPNAKLPNSDLNFQQTRVYPHRLGAGSARPNPKMGAPDPENTLFLGFLCSEGD